jgi:hypothetical protein
MAARAASCEVHKLAADLTTFLLPILFCLIESTLRIPYEKPEVSAIKSGEIYLDGWAAGPNRSLSLSGSTIMQWACIGYRHRIDLSTLNISISRVTKTARSKSHVSTAKPL